MEIISHLLEVSEAAVDWGEVENITKAEDVPYFASLVVHIREGERNVQVSLNGVVYPKFENGKFVRWLAENFQADADTPHDSDFHFWMEEDGKEFNQCESIAFGKINESLLDSFKEKAFKMASEAKVEHWTVEYPNGIINLLP